MHSPKTFASVFVVAVKSTGGGVKEAPTFSLFSLDGWRIREAVIKKPPKFRKQEPRISIQHFIDLLLCVVINCVCICDTSSRFRAVHGLFLSARDSFGSHPLIKYISYHHHHFLVLRVHKYRHSFGEREKSGLVLCLP